MQLILQLMKRKGKPLTRNTAKIVGALTAVGMALHVKAQQIGDRLIWPKPPRPRVEIKTNPCQSLKTYLEGQEGRAPAIDALIQLCITKSKLNHQMLNTALDAAIPNVIALEAKAINNNISPAQTAISLRAQLAKTVQVNCQNLARTRPRLCNEATQRQVDSDVDKSLVRLIMSQDDREAELGLQWALNLGIRAENIAQEIPSNTLKNKASKLILLSRAQDEKNRSKTIAPHLIPGDPLSPIAALESIRLNQPQLNASIKGLIENDPSSLAAAIGRMTDVKNTP